MKSFFNKLKEKYYNWNLSRIRRAILNTNIEMLLALIGNNYNINIKLSNGMEGYILNSYICQATNRGRSLRHCIKGIINDGNKEIKVYFVKVDNRLEVLLRERSKVINNTDIIYITDVISYYK